RPLRGGRHTRRETDRAAPRTRRAPARRARARRGPEGAPSSPSARLDRRLVQRPLDRGNVVARDLHFLPRPRSILGAAPEVAVPFLVDPLDTRADLDDGDVWVHRNAHVADLTRRRHENTPR